MKIKTTLLTIITLALPASAAVTINSTIANTYEQNGSSLVLDGTYGIIIVDTSDSNIGFSSLSTDLVGFDLSAIINPTSTGTATTFGNYEVLGIYQSAGGGFITATNDVELDGAAGATIDTGDSLALVWFDKVYTATTIAAGQKFGLASGFADSDNLSDNTIAYEIGGDSNAQGYTFLEMSLGGTLTNNSLFAGDTVVPEPSSVALLGLGSVALLLRRRR